LKRVPTCFGWYPPAIHIGTCNSRVTRSETAGAACGDFLELRQASIIFCNNHPAVVRPVPSGATRCAVLNLKNRRLAALRLAMGDVSLVSQTQCQRLLKAEARGLRLIFKFGSVRNIHETASLLQVASFPRPRAFGNKQTEIGF